MRNMRKLFPMAIAFFALLLLVACATLPEPYLTARLEFNSAVQRYLIYYDAATPELKAKWKAEIDPKILAAETALDAWGLARSGPGGVPPDKIEEALDAKNALIDVLNDIYTQNKGG